MKLAIFDDDIIFSQNLSKEFNEYYKKLISPIEIEIISKNFSLDSFDDLDIAFIDIDLNGKNGIALAKYMTDISPKILIIFISSRDELVFNALSVPTFQFIRKSKFKEGCAKVFNQLYKHLQIYNKKIILEINGRKTVLNLNEIQYLLSFGRDLLIKTIINDYIIVSTMKEIMHKIEEKSYNDLIQISRNQIVNLNYVNNIKSSNVILNDGSKYSIGRKYKSTFIKKYEEFLLR